MFMLFHCLDGKRNRNKSSCKRGLESYQIDSKRYTQYNNCTLMFLVNLISCYTLILLLFLGAGKVFSDLEKGARVMIRTAGKETSKTAEHKLA